MAGFLSIGATGALAFGGASVIWQGRDAATREEMLRQDTYPHD
jgi:hypothetical protein